MAKRDANGNIVLPGGGGGGDVATDAIWDAKGDLAVGTGADVATRLAVGTDGQVLKANSATGTGLEWGANTSAPADGDKGDITVSGSGATWTIDANAVTLDKMADVATATILGRATAGTGDPEALTGTQATALLDAFTSGAKGLAPAGGGGTTNYLRADGTWAAPAGGGGSPTTTLGDLIRRGASADERLPIGSAGQVLTVVSGEPAWAAATGGGGGGGGGATNDGVHAQRSTSFSVPASTWTPITWVTEVRDDNGYYDAGSPTKITIPENGWYALAGNVYWAATATQQALSIGPGAPDAAAGNEWACAYEGNTSANRRQSVSTVRYCTAGQDIYLYVYSVGATTLDCAVQPANLSAHRLGGGAAAAGGGALEFVGEAIVTGSAATDLTLSGLDLDADEHYFLDFTGLNATGSTAQLSVYFNGDTTATNYWRNVSTVGGAGNGVNNAILFSFIANGATVVKGDLMVDMAGRARMGTRSNYGDGANKSEQDGSLIWQTVANVTSITISSSIASALSVGTRLRMWKYTQAAGVATYPETCVYKSADEARSSTTTLADDSDLLTSLAANSKYIVELDVWVETSATPDFKFDINFTGTTTSAKTSCWYPNAATASVNAGATTTASGCYLSAVLNSAHAFNVSATQTICLQIKVNIETGASAGVLSFRWAQNTSNATAVTVTRDSTMIAKKVA